MRTTIDIPDALFREVKSRTGREGITLKQFITDAVRQKLSGCGGKGKALAFPVIPKGRLKPIPSLTGADIERMEIDDLLRRR